MKKYAEWTLNRWEKQLFSLLDDRKQPTGGKVERCRMWRRGLEEAGDWDALPAHIKWPLTFWTNIEPALRKSGRTDVGPSSVDISTTT